MVLLSVIKLKIFGNLPKSCLSNLSPIWKYYMWQEIQGNTFNCNWGIRKMYTARKMSKYGKIRTRKNSVFGDFLRIMWTLKLSNFMYKNKYVLEVLMSLPDFYDNFLVLQIEPLFVTCPFYALVFSDLAYASD